MKRSLTAKVIALVFILAAAALLGIARGAVDIPFPSLMQSANRPVLYLRLLRVLVAAVAGSGLAVSGIVLQAILRNPLAEPYLLGTSSGAGFGAVVAVVLGAGGLYLPPAAFAGAVLSVMLVYAIARQGEKIPVQSLILSGVIVSVALSAIIVFAVSVSADGALHGLMWWLWGSLEVYDIRLFSAVALAVVAGIFAVFCFSQDMNAMSIGEEHASHLGIRTEQVKKALFFITSFMSASIVCVSGIIGFVGLIVPHIMRLVVGPDHRVLIPCTCLAASAFMIVCDMLGRTLLAPLEIPIGVITAVVGAPIFVILLKTRQGAR